MRKTALTNEFFFTENPFFSNIYQICSIYQQFFYKKNILNQYYL